MWNILLYYLYTDIENPVEFAKEHLKFCKELGLKGRILVASEGINGTVGGEVAATEKYMEAMRIDPRFKDIVFKISEGEEGTFKKMFVRPRSELVTLNFPEKIDPHTLGGTYLKPKQLKEMYDKKEEFVIVDMRNEYEAKIGRFKDAVILKMRVFKELPGLIKDLEKYKDKKVVTYCTGGIRCEKASALLRYNGFKDVYQLEGGIATYGKEFPNDYWEGKLFVFDERMQVPINTPDQEKVIGRCFQCEAPWDQYSNCANVECNELILQCAKCREVAKGTCSHECEMAKRVRPISKEPVK